MLVCYKSVLGSDRAEFPVVIRVDSAGRLYGAIRGSVGNAKESMLALMSEKAPKYDVVERSSFSFVKNEAFVLITLSRHCDPCAAMEDEFLKFAELRSKIKFLVLEVRVEP